MTDLKTPTEEQIDEFQAACPHESMLITTDSFEEFSREMSASLKEFENNDQRASNIVDIQGKSDVPGKNVDVDGSGRLTQLSNSESSSTLSLVQTESPNDGSSDCDDYLHDTEWLNKQEHVFILSKAGKPIYSLYGNEDKLATLFGVMQALVSVVQSNEDTIQSIQAKGIRFVFLVKSQLILVAVSRKKKSVQQIQMQLTDVYNQILSTLTLSHMNRIFEQRKNFDLRRLLGGSERLIDNLLECGKSDSKISNNPFIFLTHSVRILPLTSAVRETITSAIQSNCSKIKNLVFAVLIANNKLITLVRMKKYFVHPADLRLIFNLIECSESFKNGEIWLPICLPKFDSNGYLYTHVSYLSDDCQACLLLLTVDREAFFQLSEAKKKITDKLRRSQTFKAINDAMQKDINLRTIGIPEIRHFLYKSKSNAQLLCSEVTMPYNTPEGFERLESLYYGIHNRIHSNNRPLKLILEMREEEIMLAWVTSGYELYATFEPMIDNNTVITLVNKLLSWIKKGEDVLFILNAPTF
ncbi:Vacuolar fusion protein MON1 like A [Pseudolycoriella hygida]|uniref:Vacuolar fusion protein MON1 homolog n=1 Tax=Pseudolycoriella hygida TaxID=35572 RepID=A0A9Q0NE28_9DIPT|nr:Vacuolar fusion protein MON1 like A [Pseudolycoriella hygida]